MTIHPGPGSKSLPRTAAQRAAATAAARAWRAKHPELVRAAQLRYQAKQQALRQKQEPTRLAFRISASRVAEAQAIRKVVAQAALDGTLTRESPWYSVDAADILLAPLPEDTGKLIWSIPTHRRNDDPY